ncbi:uncharacterized protein BCR38DRAFT_418328 [Pseudomassariella vexata]|uniref:Uncharacterized protein n=1 Tax=Pseudomassariella vexata TaxID=1141098 RepID=A0A1Y2EK27_9PEZI|nr:uncharacterized protein BCR38DRAFT_418328 [Pseudomassariella vexata]ORY71900.1 hypothetical protein BCR38DRAFT_418328 [Pseudomassariella vexata]
MQRGEKYNNVTLERPRTALCFIRLLSQEKRSTTVQVMKSLSRDNSIKHNDHPHYSTDSSFLHCRFLPDCCPVAR